ncbi:MAG: hypothetical protein EU529_13905 [Promethearchaeota archaeon]|nr:MAG: hypothetical protein EU529_13905 [Candidatus Lokiarchaeota archaeon]
MKDKGNTQTIIFRLHPTPSQERKLHEIFTIYNRVRRIGYKMLFEKREVFFSKNKHAKDGLDSKIHAKLMEICRNNPYVNTIKRDNQTRLKQQATWLKKRKNYMKNQIKEIKNKIDFIKSINKRDRRLRGLYARLSSIQNTFNNLKLKPVIFGTKQWFRERIKGNISKEEFKLKRDASFSCEGKKQYGVVNLNIKVLSNHTVRIKTFHKEKEKKYLYVPFTVNISQEKWYREILTAEKYMGTIKRKVIKGELRYFAHISYDIPEAELRYNFEKGAIGLDFNYNFVSLSNIDKKGNLKSYHEISFRNLHTLRKNARENYISYKMEKVIDYCINKNKGLVIEDLAFDQEFSYNKKHNRKLSNLKTTALDLLERKCIKRGIAIRKVHPHYTSLIGKYKYSRSYNLSTHVLASYVIARRGLGFKESIPAIYKRLLSQVGEMIEPRLKKGSPYYEWSQIHDLLKHSGITSFKTSEIMKISLLVKDVLNLVTSEQPDNLTVGLSSEGKIENYYKFWNFIEITNLYK